VQPKASRPEVMESDTSDEEYVPDATNNESEFSSSGDEVLEDDEELEPPASHLIIERAVMTETIQQNCR
jgi:hypothetical protein